MSCIFTLNVYSQVVHNESISYVSPKPASLFNSTTTCILVKFKSPLLPKYAEDISNYSIQVGRNKFPFSVRLIDDNKTLSIQPTNPLPQNTRVDVHIGGIATGISSQNASAYDFYFMTSPHVVDSFNALKASQKPAMQNGTQEWISPSSSVKDLIDSQMQVTVTANNHTSTGYYFVSTIAYFTNLPNRCMIIDNNGKIVFDRVTTGTALDFKKLTDSTFSYFDTYNKCFKILDLRFHEIDSITAKNGYITDNHELIFDKKTGHYLLLAQEYVQVDMSDSVLGGRMNAWVISSIIQELDKNKNLVFEWKAIDHLPVTASVGIDLTAAYIDYVHSNAIEISNDSTLFLSSRNLNEVEKINRNTGELIWRWGLNAKYNNFQFVNDTLGFTYQHDPRILPNGHITIYDDGNLRQGYGSKYSRALEYELNETNRTAKLVWQYRNTPDVYSPFMGNVQRLSNGNTLVGWGATNSVIFTEVDSLNQKVMEIKIPGIYCYRSFKFEIDSIVRLNQEDLQMPAITNFCNQDSIYTMKHLSNYLFKDTVYKNFVYEIDIDSNAASVYTKTDNDFYNQGHTNIQFAYDYLLNKDTLVCEGDSIQLQVTGACKNATYLWSNQETKPSIYFHPDTTSFVWVDITNGNYSRRDSLKIQVSSIPDFGISGKKNFLSPYEFITFSVPYNPNYRYNWHVDNNHVKMANNDSNVVSFGMDSTNSTNITAVIINQDGCSKSSKIKIEYLSQSGSATELFRKKLISLYPNPTNDLININVQESYSYQIFDDKGALIKNETNVRVGQTTIDTNEMPSGVYILVLSLSNTKEKYKIIKQ